MRQKLRRLLSLVLVFSMTMSLLSLNVWAANGAEKEYDYVVTLDNAQEETPVEGLAAELLAQKGIADETGTWSSDNGEVLAIDEAWNAVAYRAGEVTVSYTYMAAAEPEEETPGEDLGVIPPEVPGEDEDEGKDDTIPGVNEGEDGTAPGVNEGEDGTTPGENEGEDGTTPGENEGGEDGTTPGVNEGEDGTAPGENEGEDGTTPGENEGGEDDTTPGVNEGEDGTTPGENEGGEDDTTPSENEGSENETTPDEIVDDGTNVTEASRVYYTGPEGGEVETITETWTVLVQDCDAIREIRALMQAFLDDYTEYANAIRAYVLGEELDTDLDFDEFDNRYGEMQDLQYTLRDMGIDWPAVPGTQEDYDLYDAVMKLVTGEAADLSAQGVGTIAQTKGADSNNWGRNSTVVYGKNNEELYKISDQNDYWFHYDSRTKQIAFCVEPGIGGMANSNTQTWTPKENAVLTSAQIKALVNKVVACGYTGSYAEGWPNAPTDRPDLWQPRNRSIATQLLIWEVIVGDRDIDFNKITHSTTGGKGYIEYAYSKCNMLGNICGGEYVTIANMVQDTCGMPAEKIGNSYELSYQNGTYTTTLKFDIPDKKVETYAKDGNLPVTTVARSLNDYQITCSNRNVSLTTDGKDLIVTSTQPFDTATITIKPKKQPSASGGLLTWSDGYQGKQDIVMLGTTTADYNDELEITVTAPQATADLTLKKTLGNGGGETKDTWKFKVTLTDANGNVLNGLDLGNNRKTNGKGVVSVDVTAGTDVVLKNIPIGSKYTVVETDANQNGYTTTDEVKTKTELTASGATVTITNTRGVGSLKVTKILAGDTNPEDKTTDFTINIELTDPSGATLPAVNVGGKDVAGTSSKQTYEVKLKGDESVEITGIPVGVTYKVDEKAHNGYAPRFENCDGTIIAGTTPVEARVINTRYNGNIAVTKQTTGNGGDTDTFFDFSITMKDASGVAIPREQFTVEFYDAGGNKDENRIVTGTSGTFTFKLKHGDLIVFNGLPNGTEYTVEEKNPSSNGYKSTVEEDQWTINRPGPRKAKGLDKTNTVVRTGGNTSADLVTHVFKNDRGAASLSITKEFEGCTPRTNGYEFTITLKDADGKDLAGSQWAQYTVKDETGEIGNGKIDSLKNTISLYPGETATFPKLPTGTTYTVTEKQYDGYAATEKSEGTVSKEQDGTEIKLEYLNKWKSGALEVTKTLGGPAAAGEEITFVITLDFSEADLLKSGAAVEQLADWVEAKDSGDAKVDLVKVDENKYTVTVTKEIEETDKEVTLASLTKIPVGTKYTVAEVVKTDVYDYNAEGYEVLYRRNGSELKQIEAKDYTEDGKASTEGFTIETDGQADIVAITNFRTAGSLEISKKVVSDVIIENAGEQFTFKIDLTFPRSADSTEFLNSHVHVKVDDGEKGESWANDNDLKQNDDGTWTWEIKLVDGAKATISGLPASTKYTVREVEANLNGYITTVMFNGDPVEVGAGTVANKASAENEQVDEFLCTNTRFDGNLAVMKMLDGEGAYDTDEFQFTMELTSPYGDIGGFTDSEDDVDPMGVDSDDSQNASWWANGVIEAAEYTIYKNGQDEAAHGALADLRGNDGRFRFMLRGGDLITFAKLPDEALYTVTEDTNNWNGYSTDIRAYGIMMFDDEDAAGEPEEETYEQQSSVSGMIDKNADQLLLTCVNHRGVGELAVSKLLVGTGADASRSWTFRVRLTDANGDPLTVNAWTANGEEKQLTVKETGALVTLDASGMTTLTMRGGETRTITNLPNGTRYSVEEVSANTDGYYTSSSNTTGTIYEKTEEYDGVSRVTFTNRREPGTLTVSKTVGGNAGDVYRPFEFVVTLTAPEGRPGDSLPNPVKARLEDYREGTETELTLPLSEENTVTFELTHDQAMVLLDLDEGTGYSVAETPAAGYVTRVAGDIEGVLSANGTAVAAFTNTANVYREGDDDDDDDDTTRTEERGPGEEPELPVELPNPNEPDSPDTVTILEDDVPTTYVKVPDPENEEEFIYIPEDEIPLQGFEIPETGDNGQTILWAVLSAASLTGIVALGIPSRKKEEEEQ